jgi:hypothetical protein
MIANQRGERMADSNDASRKTLDEIRRELAAEYAIPSQAEEAPVEIVEDHPPVERDGSVERRPHRRRRYALAAILGGVAALLLIVPGRLALTREPVRLNANASASAVAASSASPANAIREGQPATPMLGSAALSELDREVKALRSDLKTLADRLGHSDSRIGGIESRVQGVESSMQRLGANAAPAAAARAERPVPVRRQRVKAPEPSVAVAPSAAPIAAPDPERWIAAKPPVVEASSAPAEVRPVVDESPSPSSTMTSVDSSRPASAVSEAPPTLRQKLHAEWRTIKQAFSGAGDNFKAVMRDFSPKVTRD